MRKLALVAVLLFASLAVAAGLALDTSQRFEFTDCASGGSAAQTVTEGQYLMRVTDTDVYMCTADSGSTCATGGERFPVGTVIVVTFGRGGKSTSCRSSASTGDLILTAVR